MYNSKGQAGSVFKLLIGAVIGLAIIGIVYSIIVVMGQQKNYLSEEVFSNKIKMAMKNPTGEGYLINDFAFANSKIMAKKSLSEQTGLGTTCITLKKGSGAPDNISINPPDDATYITFPKSSIVDLEITCDVGNETDCPIKCVLAVFDRGYKRWENENG